MTDTDVLIVGAGPTGLVLALSLARQGVRFRIIDRASGSGQASRALAVHARTLEVYRQLGFADDAVARGVQVRTIRMRGGGRDRARVDFADMGAGLSPYPFVLVFPQDDHERFLIEQLKAGGVVVEWNVALADLAQDGAGVTVVLSHADGARETVRVAYLVGCDGVHSRVRESLRIAFPGGTYDQIFYVADVMAGGAGIDDLSVSLDADGFVLMMPVRSRGARRLVGVLPSSSAADGAPPDSPPTIEAVRPLVERLLGLRIDQVNWFSTYHVHHRVASRFRVGRCFLAGDAGHVHSPAGGQGMNTGIGDAFNLAWKLALTIKGTIDPAVLDTYETERIPFARALVASTDRAFQGIVGTGVVGRLIRTLLAPRVLRAVTRFAAGRRALFEVVSQIRIAYRDSALSEGRAGCIRAGDRLPWVAAADGATDNFASLRTCRWQAHVYGEPSTEVLDALAVADVPLHVLAWSTRAATAGLKRGAVYLVRPDGHVALASGEPDSAALTAYFARWRLAISPPG